MRWRTHEWSSRAEGEVILNLLDIINSPVQGRRSAMIKAAIERCAGIDVGKKWLAVCVMVGPLDAEPRTETRRFGTNVADPDILAGLVPAGGHHARGHGEHRLILEAGVPYLRGAAGSVGCANA